MTMSLTKDNDIWSPTAKPRIVVVGGGAGGAELVTALGRQLGLMIGLRISFSHRKEWQQ